MISRLTKLCRSTKSARRQRRKSWGLVLESLENRNLMAADGFATVADGAWTFDPSTPKTTNFGEVGDVFVAGDWFGSGQDYRAIVRPNESGDLLWESTDGVSTVSVVFGKEGDIPVVGDWNGDGVDNLGVVRKGPHGFMEWHIDLDLDKEAELVLHYGLNTDIPVVGNWDDDPGDEIGVVRDWGDGLLTWLIDTDGDPTEEITYKYGLAGDIPIVGDWDGDGGSNLGVVRPTETGAHRWYLGTNTDATEDIVFDFGRVGDVPVTGQFEFPEIYAGYVFRIAQGGIPLEIRSNPEYDLQKTSQLGWIEDHRPTLTTEVEIRNDGTVPLHLSDIRIVQGTSANETYKQFTILSSPEWVAPGTSENIVIFVDGTDSTLPNNYSEAFIEFNTNDLDESPFIFHVYTRKPDSITPSVRSPEISVKLQQQHLSDGRSEIKFDSVAKDTPNASKTLTIKNVGRADLVVSDITSSNSQFAILGQTSFILPQGKSQSFEVQMRTHVVGKHSTTIQIFNNDKNEGVFDFRVAGEVTGEPGPIKPGEPDIQLHGVPANGTIDFGNTQQNKAKPRRTITIENRGDKRLDLSVHVSGSRFSIVGKPPKSLSPGKSYDLQIVMNTNVVGAHAGQLTIQSNDPDEKTIRTDLAGSVAKLPVDPPDVHIRIRETPLSPLLDLVPGETGFIDFSGAVQASATKNYRAISFTIENRGEQPLLLSNLSTPTGYDIPSLRGIVTIEPGQSKQFEIQMDLLQLGQKEGTISFRTNDPDEQVIRIQVRGKVFPPAQKNFFAHAAQAIDGVYKVYTSGPVEIQPISGLVAGDARHVVVVDGAHISLGVTVGRVRVFSEFPVRIDNWTNLKHESVTNVRTQLTGPLENLPPASKDDETEPTSAGVQQIIVPSPDGTVEEQVRSANTLDVNRDGSATALDALIVINELNSPTPAAENVRQMDVNGDSSVTALDALMIINHLNNPVVVVAEGEATMGIAPAMSTIDIMPRSASLSRSSERTNTAIAASPAHASDQPKLASPRQATVVASAPRQALDELWADYDSSKDAASELTNALHNAC